MTVTTFRAHCNQTIQMLSKLTHGELSEVVGKTSAIAAAMGIMAGNSAVVSVISFFVILDVFTRYLPVSIRGTTDCMAGYVQEFVGQVQPQSQGASNEEKS